MDFRNIIPNQQFEWSFREKYLSKTLFCCHFWWDSKQKAFEVFNVFNGCIKNSQLDPRTHLCKWTVTDAGFFLEDDRSKKYLAYSWDT